MNRFVLFALATATAVVAGCKSDSTSPPPIAGTYTATTLSVTPSGQSSIDVLAQGGTLSITIAADNSTTGTLYLPSSVTGGAPMTASMAGTAVRSGSAVRFQQSADTFVRDLVFTLSGTSLQVTNQTVATATYTVVLKRQ